MRPRRPTKAFEENSTSEWEFYIADRLGLTVARMREEMSGDEFTRWVIFHQRKGQRMELASKGAGNG